MIGSQSTQPESGNQEAAPAPEQSNLGKSFDEHSIAEFLKNNFLNEEGAAPAKEEQQTEPEVTEEVAEETEADPVAEEEVEQPVEEDDNDDPQLSKGVQKRINKLVAAKKAAQAELEAQKARLAQLQQELEQTKSSVPAYQPQQSEWSESLASLDQVKKEYDSAINTLLWCEANPDGGVLPLPDGKELELSQEQVRILKTESLRRKEIELPTRFQYLQNQAAAEKEVAVDFPWWNKPESEEFQAAQFVLREFPDLKKKRADWKHVAGLVVLGMKAYNEQKAKKTAPAKPPIKRAPAQPSVKAPPAAPKDDVTKARKAFVSDTSNKDGLMNLLKAQGFV